MNAKLLLTLLLILACPCLSRADAWPDHPLTIIVSSQVGGGLDSMARGLAHYLQPILGVPVIVSNKPGGMSSVANYELLQQPADANSLLVTITTPSLISTILNLDVDYSLSDFEVLNDQWSSAESLQLRQGLDYPNLLSLLDDIAHHPKKLSAGVLPGFGGHLGLLLLLEKHGIPADNLRIVYFGSGSQFRTAIAGGHIDIGIISLEAADLISEMLLPVAVFSENRQPGYPQLPTINESLAPRGLQIPEIPSFIRSILIRAETRELYPERYAKLVDALKRVFADTAFQKDMHERMIGYDWIGPEQSTVNLKKNFQSFSKFNHMLNKRTPQQ